MLRPFVKCRSAAPPEHLSLNLPNRLPTVTDPNRVNCKLTVYWSVCTTGKAGHIQVHSVVVWSFLKPFTEMTSCKTFLNVTFGRFVQYYHRKSFCVCSKHTRVITAQRPDYSKRWFVIKIDSPRNDNNKKTALRLRLASWLGVPRRCMTSHLPVANNVRARAKKKKKAHTWGFCSCLKYYGFW